MSLRSGQILTKLYHTFIIKSTCKSKNDQRVVNDMGHLRAKDGTKNLSGPRVRALREKEGLSQEELMARLQLMGMDAERGVIKRIENGDRAVSDLELRLLARYFKVSYQYLIDGTQ